MRFGRVSWLKKFSTGRKKKNTPNEPKFIYNNLGNTFHLIKQVICQNQKQNGLGNFSHLIHDSFDSFPAL